MLATRLAVLLGHHVQTNGRGIVMTAGGFHFARNPDTVREPDVAFARAERIPPDGVPEGFWPGPPDLAIEVRSPGDRRPEILAKVADYLASGVRLVWVVDPEDRTVTTYAPHEAPLTLGPDGVLSGGEVVPGFCCRVSSVFTFGR